jgi:hypothetical protein
MFAIGKHEGQANFFINILKVALKSQKVFHFGSKLQKWVPNHNPDNYPDAQGRDFALIFGVLSQSGKLFEIKPPLV